MVKKEETTSGQQSLMLSVILLLRHQNWTFLKQFYLYCVSLYVFKRTSFVFSWTLFVPTSNLLLNYLLINAEWLKIKYLFFVQIKISWGIWTDQLFISSPAVCESSVCLCLCLCVCAHEPALSDHFHYCALLLIQLELGLGLITNNYNKGQSYELKMIWTSYLSR